MNRAIRLFDESSLRKLEQLTLSATATRIGALKGERKSRRRGTSIEFADYRNYTQGDDLRRLDWNVYARLERPFIKVTHDEEELAVHIMVDTSASMNWPPIDSTSADEQNLSINKLIHGLRIAGALGYIGLSEGDLVTISLTDNTTSQTWGPFRSRQNGWPLIRFLEANILGLISSESHASPRKTELVNILQDYSLRVRRPGLFILLSDLFPSNPGKEDTYQAGLQALQSRGYDPVVIQILSPDEVAPLTGGDLKLIDSETGEEADITVDASAIEAYLDRMQLWKNEVQTYCRARHIRFFTTVTDQNWDNFVLHSLRQEGVIT